MEAEIHGPLKSCFNIFKDKWHNSIHKCAPWGCECDLILAFFLDLNLVIAKKTIHEGEGFMFGARIDERCGEVVFGTCPIKVMKVCANVNGTLFFIHGNKIRNPSGVRNGVNEVSCAQLLNFGFDHGSFGRMDGPLILVHGGHIGPCVDVVFHNGWIQPRHISVGAGKDVAEFLEESFVGNDFLRGGGCPQHDFFNNLRIG